MLKNFILFLFILIFSSRTLFCLNDGDKNPYISVPANVSYIEKINSALLNLYDSINIWWLNDMSISDSLRNEKAPRYPEYIYKSRIEDLNQRTPIKLEYNEYVLKYIEAYSLKNRPKLKMIMAKSVYYFPIFEGYLSKYGLPLELKYLAAVESALDPNAVSKSGAVGLWQFMKPTSDLFDIVVTSYIDERKDAFKSTDAACKYLKYLYETFGDWQLALAAYNGGPGTVKKAIARSGGKTNYWELRPYFTEQMQNYVPAFIAMNYLMCYHSEHNIFPEQIFIENFKTDTLMIEGYVHLRNISELVGVDYNLLKLLNPIYTYAYIPMDGNFHSLVLPIEAVHKFYEKQNDIIALKDSVAVDTLANIPPFLNKPIRENTVYHQVIKGDNLFRIAQKYDCSIPEIYKWNELNDNYVLKVGDKLKIYVK